MLWLTRQIGLVILLACATATATASAGEIVVALPSPVSSAKAGEAIGRVSANEATFQTDKPISPDIRLADGTHLLPVDMNWYTSAPAKGKEGEAISEDDRKQIEEILTVPSFYDKVRLIHLAGDSQHAVGLVDLLRDRDFHAGKGEVIWRIELWYFEFQNGGWAKVSQQNKMLDRQRFASVADYRAYTSKLRLVPRLAKIAPGDTPTRVELREGDLLKVP